MSKDTMFIYSFMLHVAVMILKINGDKVVSDENIDRNARKDKNTYSGAERRYMDDLDHAKWHISHLKDTDFNSRRSNCPEETFEEKAEQYRKSLQRDGALVEYVSADALPFDLKDLKTDVCKIPDDTKRVFKVSTQATQEPGPNTGVPSKVEATTELGRNASAKSNNETEENQGTQKGADIIATTTATNDKRDETPEKDGRRASEYLFSSIEYYDEGPAFDVGICPYTVGEITLEQDHIRSYDVRCEQILLWTSFD